MIEPRALQTARELLAIAEQTYRTEGGLAQLEEALALLDVLIVDNEAKGQQIARNLAAAYAAKLCKSIAALIERDRALPEPELEHLFRVMLAFDQGDFDLPEQSGAVKIRIARRLIDRYFEGYPPEAKQKAVDELLTVSAATGRKKGKKRTGP